MRPFSIFYLLFLHPFFCTALGCRFNQHPTIFVSPGCCWRKYLESQCRCILVVECRVERIGTSGNCIRERLTVFFPFFIFFFNFPRKKSFDMDYSYLVNNPIIIFPKQTRELNQILSIILINFIYSLISAPLNYVAVFLLYFKCIIITTSNVY